LGARLGDADVFVPASTTRHLRAHRSALRLVLICPSGCRAALHAQLLLGGRRDARSVALDGTRLALQPGEARTLTVRLGSEDLRALRSAGDGRLRVQIVVGDRTVTRSWAIG
jgi:hypothetical protein